MIEVKLVDNAFLIVPDQPRREGMLLHGYGGNKEELLGLAVNLATALRVKLLVPDLPGHGSREDALDLSGVLAWLDQTKSFLSDPDFVIGHSLGARLALMAQPPLVALISMPGAARFEGSRSELLRTLRVRRVREAAPLAGLEEILSQAVAPAPGTLMLRARQELETVAETAEEWRQRYGIDSLRVPASNHNDIVSSPQTCNYISQWLQENLP